jgi:Family of unknown function (DUF5681)
MKPEPDVSSDVTGPKQKPQLFRPGTSGNPSGRPRGARSKLGEAFLEDLRDAWETHGVAALTKCATEKPEKFCSITASLLPKEVIVAALKVNGGAGNPELMNDFSTVYMRLRAMVFAEAPEQAPDVIEIEAERRDSELSDED